MRHEHSCGAVIVNEFGEFVIIHSVTRHFGFPKGHMEPGETEEETALREIREEVGLEVQLIPGFRMDENYLLRDCSKTVTYFLGQCKHQKLRPLPSELLGAEFLPFAAALHRLSFDSAKDILRSAAAFLQANLPRSLLTASCNTRDLGGYACPGGTTKRLSVLRSDVASRLSKRDLSFLKRHQITTLIDLRGDAEIAKAQDPFAVCKGLRYCRCPIEDGGKLPTSPEEVPLSYLEIARHPGLAAALHCIAVAPQGVLFHCTAGKDRTGVLSALLLLLAGVSESDIVTDYALTGAFVADLSERFLRSIPEAKRKIYAPLPEYMRSFLRLFSEAHGTPERFCKEIGLSEAEVQAIRKKLTAQP